MYKTVNLKTFYGNMKNHMHIDLCKSCIPEDTQIRFGYIQLSGNDRAQFQLRILVISIRIEAKS